MWKAAANRIINGGSVALAAYEMGKNSEAQPAQPIIIQEQKPPVETEKHPQNIELWVVMAVVIILLIAISVKVLVEKKRPIV